MNGRAIIANRPTPEGDTPSFADVATTLISPEQLQSRIAALGAQITQDYAGRAAPPVLIGVLRGVVFFMADLIRAIDLPVEVDFMAITRYGPQTRGAGSVRVLQDLELSITGRDVILVEDVIDTGLPLAYVLRLLRAHQPASLEVCTLLDRQGVRLIDIRLAYVGFEVPDQFLVGYGLDLHGQYRNLPYIGLLKAAAAVAAPYGG